MSRPVHFVRAFDRSNGATSNVSIGIAVLGMLAVILGVTVLVRSDPQPTVVLTVATGVVLAFPILMRIARGTFDPFEPLGWAAAAWAVMFVVRPAAEIAARKYELPLYYNQTFSIEPGLQKALEAALVGAGALVLGYHTPVASRLGRRLGSPRGAMNWETTALIAVAFGLAGAATFVVFIVSGGGATALQTFLGGRSLELTQLQANAGKYLLFGPLLLLTSSLLLIIIGADRRSRWMRLSGIAFAAMLFATAVPIGQRSLIFPLPLALALNHFLVAGRRPRATVLVAAAMVLLTLSAFIATERDAFDRTTAGPSDVARRLADDPARVFAPLTSEADASEVVQFAAVLALPTNSLEHFDGRATVGDFATRLVPRAIWTGKPVPPRQVATRAVYGSRADELVLNPEFSVLLYPYLDAGLAGVFLVLGFYGFVLRVLWGWTLQNVDNVLVRIVFIILMPALAAGLRDSPVDTAYRAVIYLVPLMIAVVGGRVTAERRFGSRAPASG